MPLIPEKEVAKKFDFDAIKSLTTKTDAGTDISFSIWDYGEQEVFYTLHPIFLSREGVHLLVFDMCKNLKKETEKSLELLQFWLNSLKLHAQGAPIIMVGSRMDQLSNESLIWTRSINCFVMVFRLSILILSRTTKIIYFTFQLTT